MKLDIGEPVKVEELVAKPSSGGRQPSEADLALTELVTKVAEKDNANVAFPWNYGSIKPLTARAMATRAIKRAGMEGTVYVGSKEGKLWFSQTRISNRGRTKK